MGNRIALILAFSFFYSGPVRAYGQARKPDQSPTGSTKKDQSLAQISVTTGDAGLIRAGDRTRILTHNGDLIFAGDTLVTKAGTATFVYCPPGIAAREQKLEANGRLQFQSTSLTAQPGTLSAPKGAPYCELPAVQQRPQTSAKGPENLDTRPASKPFDPSQLTPADRQRLAAIDAVLAKDPNHAVAKTSRTALLARNGFFEDAVSLAKARPDLPWTKELIHEPAAAANSGFTPNGPVYAIVIGISKYGRPASIPDLKFADRDAQSFYQYLKSPRGGSLPDSNIKLLTNDQATSAAIKDYVNYFLGRPRSKLIIFLSGHGAVSNGEGYLATYRSDPANLKDSAYPMRAFTNLMYSSPVGRVEIYVDACHAGHIGSITEANSINRFLMPQSGSALGFLASEGGKDKYSWEYAGLGQGHGAFTYFLLWALNSRSNFTNGQLTVYDLNDDLRKQVRFLTSNNQTPERVLESVDENEPVALLAKPGIPVEKWDGKPMPPSLFKVQKSASLIDVEQPAPPAPGASGDQDLDQLIAFENQGQAVLLRYLKGDEIPQDRHDFEQGLNAYTSALRLQPDSLLLASRQKFFEGRIAVGDRNWSKAREALEDSIRLDPASPSAYNALGISYLEQAQYDDAISAFSDAIQRAPYWPYPRHNLALTYSQQGEYQLAIDIYQKAMAMSPTHSYLPYNLGLLFMRLNRTVEAQEWLLKAKDLAAKRADEAERAAHDDPSSQATRDEALRLEGLRVPPAAALSALHAKQGDRRGAKRYYEEARSLLQRHPDTRQLLIVRHNYATFMAGTRGGMPEARRLWQENIDEANYVPSRVSMAEAFVTDKASDLAGAIAQYSAAVVTELGNVGIRLRLAELLQQDQQPENALAQLIEANSQTRDSVLILERMGDLQSRLQRPTDARTSYLNALQFASDPAVRARLTAKASRLK